ncbi:MAG TPA: hypothetical protein VHO06_22840 [Polyangia bacterium]|nr:hypothetical protein [Polyangia bacterium]
MSLSLSQTRFDPCRLSNGHYGVYDNDLAVVVVRDVGGLFASRVAACLNSPDAREISQPQLVADAVRAVLEIPATVPAALVH